MTQQLSSDTQAAIARQIGAVDNHLGRHFPVFADDIRQEAWAATLTAAPRYDPNHPGASGYFYRVAVLAVVPMIRRWLSPATMGTYSARRGVAVGRISFDSTRRYAAGRTGIDANDGSYLSAILAHQGPRPDADLVLEEARVQLTALSVRWRRAVEAATRHLPEDVRAAGALAWGLDGPRRSANTISVEIGMWLEDVTVALVRWKAALRRARQVAALEKQMTEIEETLP